MKCINCGAEIKTEYNNCPYCGKTIQMVPDYDIYDEDDINVLLEGTKNDTPINESTAKVPEKNEKGSKSTVRKKPNTKVIVALTVLLCVILLGVGIGVKISVDNKNNNSYEYQMKLGDEALFKEKLNEAESYYNKALQLSPNDLKARLKLADVYLSKDNKEKAIKLLEEVISLDTSENYDAYKKLFQIYEADGDIDAILNLKEGVTETKVLKIFQNYIVEAPSISIPGGTYSEALKLTMTAGKGIQIFYTIDGKNPISYGTLYTTPIQISDAGMHTIKLVALNSYGVYSDIVTETFVISYSAPEEPTVTPNGGTFDVPTYVYITVPEGCSAYYTWDRSEPTELSSKYVSPLLIPDGYNILSVIIINDTTGLKSVTYRGVFEYTTE